MHAISTSVVDNHVAKYGIGPAPEGLKETLTIIPMTDTGSIRL